jgi:hypothetical protein
LSLRPCKQHLAISHWQLALFGFISPWAKDQQFFAKYQLPNTNYLLLHFLMPCMLAATLAELLELQPTSRGLLVLGGRVIPLFAIAAL